MIQLSKEELYEKGIEELVKYFKEAFPNPIINCTPIRATHELQENLKKESQKEKKGEILWYFGFLLLYLVFCLLLR